MSDPVRSIVIVGDGIAAWLSALVLARATGTGNVGIQVVPARGGTQQWEDELLGSTLPHIGPAHAGLGIDEAVLMRAVRGTFKVGSEYLDWAASGDRYVHAFGDIGARLDSIAFHQLLGRLRNTGERVDIGDYSVAAQAALLGRFAHPSQDPRSPASTYSYALHLDTHAYAAFLREMALRLGVGVATGRLASVQRRADGFIESVTLDDGATKPADLFIDCSGSAAELVADALGVRSDNWAQWLSCDRALTGFSPRPSPPPTTTRVLAHSAGCQIRVPLQDVDAHSFVYRQGEVTDEQALAAMQSSGAAISGEPRVLAFAQGRRRQAWSHNCVAIGASAATLEPLGSSGIQLIHSGLARLLTLFPDRHCSVALVDEYNRMIAEEQECVRDLLILHYHATRRDDSRFWRESRAMSVPETLDYKIRLFRHRGLVSQRDEETYGASDWMQVFLGQGLWPDHVDPLADGIDPAMLRQQIERMRQVVRRTAEALPPHEAYLAKCGVLAARGR